MRKLASVVVLLSFILSLTACGGGGGGNTDTNTVVSPASVVGVFSAEQPIANADISLKDANGTVKTTVTDVNGVYYIDTSGLTPPFVIKGSYTSASVPYTYYSYLAGDFSSTDNVKANINEFTSAATTLLVAQSGNGNNPATLFSETDANRTTILNTDISQALSTLTELVCPILLSDDKLSTVGCNFAAGEDFINMLYAADPTVNDIEKLSLLIDVEIDPASGDLTARDSSGTTLTIITMDNILNGTIPVDQSITLDVAIQINNLLATLSKQDPLLNETLATQLSSGNTVTSKVEYVSVFPNADLQINNLTECPAEVRNIKVQYSNPADNLKAPNIPLTNHTPLIDTVVPEATLAPLDACKRFSFGYEFEYNLVIRKTQTGLVDGVPVWTYDVPSCEKYSNKVVEALLEETYKYTDVDFDLLFNRPAIEVRPELHRHSNTWPDSSVNFVFDSTCPVIAEFSLTPIEGTPPLTVNVDAGNSTGNIVSYEWEAPGATGAQTATGQTASFVYDNPNSFMIRKWITLTVTDTTGQTKTLTKEVMVDPLPDAAFTSTLGSASNQVKLNAVNSVGTGISYSWTASEAIDGTTRTDQNVDFTFAAPGDYTVTLVVTDKYDNTSTVSKVVTVEEVTINCKTFDPVTGFGEEGCYLANRRTGLWTVNMSYYKYIHIYENGVLNGPYTYTYQNVTTGVFDETITGTFLNGLEHGIRDALQVGYDHTIITYSNGIMHGYYEFELFTGNLQHTIGNYANGKRDGVWTTTNSTGNTYTTIYVDGVPQ